MTVQKFVTRLVVAGAIVVGGALQAHAEPMFLSKQYTRCTQCHYSETGGGLLTSYGRSLTQELSTTGHQAQGTPTETAQGEEAFLWGALKGVPKGLDFGVELRPAHLSYDTAGFSFTRNLWMNADAIGAYQSHGWTLYGEVGRQATSPGWKVGSYEHWAGYKSSRGVGIRAGRFLPAYGVGFADHTSLNRSTMSLTQYDQIYGVEVSMAADHTLVQASVSPGRATSLIDDDGRQAFTAAGRWQMDLGTNGVLVASGLYRNASRLTVRNGSGGVALGFTPARRVSIWTQADVQHRAGSGDNTYVLVNETAVEVVRGVWLKVSPQVRSNNRSGAPGLRRLALSADLLPRTHWNVNINYYRDRNTANAVTSRIFLAQFHLYL